MNAVIRLCLAIVLLLCSTSSADAAEPDDSSQSVAVVALDDTPGTQEAVSRMASLLASSGRRVEFGEQLRESVSRNRVAQPTPEQMSAFTGTSDIVADGIKAYFYQSKKRAIETLSPVVELGFAKTSVLVERPDLVDQIYEAGLVLVRAHHDTGDEERAGELAAALVAHFPKKAPSLDTAPPTIIELFRERMDALADENTRLIIDPRAIGPGDCVALLNGTKVAAGSHAIAANRSYFLRLDCGLRRSSTWRVTLQPSEVATMVLIADDPLGVALVDDSFESRRLAENYLEMAASVGGYSDVVGVKRPGIDTGPTLFAHYRGGSFTWTEVRDVSAVVGYTRDAFGITSSNSQQGLATDATAREEYHRRPDMLGWVFVGSGVAAATTGAFFLRAAIYNYRLLHCYDNVDSDRDVDCEGVLSVGREVSSERQRAEARTLRRQQTVAYALFGVGAASLGYGIYRLLRKRDAVAVWFDPRSKTAAVAGRF